MPDIRQLEADDLPVVADMFQRVFRSSEEPAPSSLTEYMKELYLDSPGCDPEIRPLVYKNDNGKITGFIGVNALKMNYHEQIIRTGICGSIMVEGREEDPFAGPRLMRAFMSGPQDISFSETASEVSLNMWKKLRGISLSQYSLDWFRIIRPSAFMLAFAKQKSGIANLLNPLGKFLDTRYLAQITAEAPRWGGIEANGNEKITALVTETDRHTFAKLLPSFMSSFAINPHWTEEQLNYILCDAEKKTEWGQLVYASVQSRAAGPVVGAFAVYINPEGIGQVLQVLSRPNQTGHVLDSLIHYAAQKGMCGLKGRTQPALIEAMLERRILFIPYASTVIHARNSELVDVFRQGNGFFNGIVGENWSRLTSSQFT